jgi:hypothetical protein
MSEIEFAERMAKIRARFALKLAVGIQETSQSLSRMAGDSPEAVEATSTAYIRFHEMCGIGPTIGFEALGRAARVLDDVLIVAYRAKRGLMDEEITKLKDGLEHVRTAMLVETGTGKPEELAS